MDEEAAFLRAIQANQSDATAKLVYADWLDERGHHDKAEYLRLAPGPHLESAQAQARRHALERVLSVWVGLVNGVVPVWDAATMYGIGRLHGLFAGYGVLSGGLSNRMYHFGAELCPHPGSIAELIANHYAADRTGKMADWEADVRTTLNGFLFEEYGTESPAPPHARLAFLASRGRDALLDDVMRHIRGVINPTTDWHVDAPPTDGINIQYRVVMVLEASDRVLLLNFISSG